MPANVNDKARLQVEAYIRKHEPWQKLLTRLRKIIAVSELEETVKWGSPAYTLQGKTLVSLVAFKQHCALWFHHGVFLQDKAKHLVSAQDSTRGLRQWRFEADSKIDAALVKAYIEESIDNARAGKKIKPVVKTLIMPDELAQALKKDRALHAAFAKLAPGKQREYAEHVGAAKQAQTRRNRLAKAIPLIKAGMGLNDKYKT